MIIKWKCDHYMKMNMRLVSILRLCTVILVLVYCTNNYSIKIPCKALIHTWAQVEFLDLKHKEYYDLGLDLKKKSTDWLISNFLSPFSQMQISWLGCQGMEELSWQDFSESIVKQTSGKDRRQT